MNKSVRNAYHKSYRLSGFTLTEMIVSLAISAVLISLVIKLFTLFSEAQNVNDINNSDIEELLQAERVMSDMISSSDSMHFYTNCLTLYFEEQKTGRFTFDESCIVFSTNESIDTFHISTGDIKCTFNPYAPELAEMLFVPVTCSGQIITLCFVKEYEGEVIVKSQIVRDEI